MHRHHRLLERRADQRLAQRRPPGRRGEAQPLVQAPVGEEVEFAAQQGGVIGGEVVDRGAVLQVVEQVEGALVPGQGRRGLVALEARLQRRVAEIVELEEAGVEVHAVKRRHRQAGRTHCSAMATKGPLSSCSGGASISTRVVPSGRVRRK